MIVAIIAFFALFVQSTAGFGLALVSMPLLVEVLGIRTATPLVSLVGVFSEIIMLSRYRQAFNLRAVARLAAASLAGIPLGAILLRQGDAAIITRLLGLIILGYALYALFSPTLPQLAHHAWAYGFGFVGGLLSGAYNTGGPPVVIYGSCREWRPAEFKSNLQGFFLINSVMTLFTHAVSGNITPAVWHNSLLTLPGVILGLWAGFSLDRRLNQQRFHKIILILLVLLGARLII